MRTSFTGIRATWRTISEPIDPPAPVTMTVLPRRKPIAASLSMWRTPRSSNADSLTLDATYQLQTMRHPTTPIPPSSDVRSVTVNGGLRLRNSSSGVRTRRRSSAAHAAPTATRYRGRSRAESLRHDIL